METSLKNRKDSSKGARAPRSSASRRGTRTSFVTEKKVQNPFLNEVLSPIPSVNLPVCDKPFGQVTENGVAYWTYKNESTFSPYFLWVQVGNNLFFDCFVKSRRNLIHY